MIVELFVIISTHESKRRLESTESTSRRGSRLSSSNSNATASMNSSSVSSRPLLESDG